VVPLGFDRRGQPVTSCIVGRTEPDLKITGAAKVALDALVSKIGGEHGGACPMADWEQACRQAGISSGTSEKAQSVAFTRARQKLPESGKISISGDVVRLPEHTEQ